MNDFSLVHVLLGFMAPFLGSTLGHVLVVGFIVYQVTEPEPWGRTLA